MANKDESAVRRADKLGVKFTSDVNGVTEACAGKKLRYRTTSKTEELSEGA